MLGVFLIVVTCLSSFPSALLAASAPSEFRTGEFIPTARRVQYHGTRSRWVDLASRHCPRFGSDGLLAIPLPAPIVPPTKKEQKKHGAASPSALLHGTYKVQFAFDGERVLTPWLTVAREDLDGKSKKKKRNDDAFVVADVPVVDLVLARAGRELLGGGATRARVSRAPQDYVAAHGGLADEWRSGGAHSSSSPNGSSEAVEQRWPRTLPVRVRWAVRPGADLAAGASALLVASLLAASLASLASLAGHAGVLRELVEGAVAAGAEEAEEALLVGRGRGSSPGIRLGGGGSGGGAGVGPGSVQLTRPQQQQQQQQMQPRPFEYQYQQQQQALAPQQPQPQQQPFRPRQQPPAPSFAARAPPPSSSSLPVRQQQQSLPSIAPPPASFTPQQQYAYYQQMHSYQQRQQLGQQQPGQQQQGQPQAPSFFSQPLSPSSFQPSSSKAD